MIMKQSTLACDDAFHEKYKGISFRDDIAISVWREAWQSAIEHVLKIIEAEKNEDHKQV